MTIEKIITIGRSDDSQYQIRRNSVSAEHAMIICTNAKKYLLIDCGSTNGTRLLSRQGTEKISQSEVRIEDLVFFGDEEHLVSTILSSGKSVPSEQIGSGLTRFRDPIDGSIKTGPRR
jgi:pSer/pThr/pTyr-binding forkhead associated (FHA) protein